MEKDGEGWRGMDGGGWRGMERDGLSFRAKNAFFSVFAKYLKR